MTKITPALLIFSTALMLTGCKDTSTSFFDWLLGGKEEASTRESLLEADESTAPYPYKTISGDYLAGRFAQSSSDWGQAYDYMAEIIPADPQNLDLKKRTMVLAMGAGHSDQAFSLARDVLNAGDPGSLPRLFLMLETFKSGKYSNVLKEMDAVPKDGISEFINPLIRAWAKAGLGQTDTSDLAGNVVHLYHAILIADYLKDDAALKKLAEKNYTQFSLAPRSLERVADIFARHKLIEPAQSLYTYIRNSDPESAKQITAKVTQLEKGIAPAVEEGDAIQSPVDGLSRALFDMASVLYTEYQDSARLFSQMSLYLDAQNNDARVLLGHMAARDDRYDEAIAYYQQIDAAGDQDLQIKLQRQIAELLEEDDKTDAAIAVLQKLVADTGDVETQIQLGDLQRRHEDFAQALKEYNKAYEMLGNNVPQKYWHLIYARGMTNERLKNWAQAEADLKAALAYEPDHPYILNYLGYSWADQGVNLDKAAEMIGRAVRLRPDDGYIVDSLGWVFFRMQKYKEAADTLEAAVELLPYDPTINDHLGDAYWRVGRKTEARFQWRRASSFAKDQVEIDTITAKIKNGLPDTAQLEQVKPAEKQARIGSDAPTDAK